MLWRGLTAKRRCRLCFTLKWQLTRNRTCCLNKSTTKIYTEYLFVKDKGLFIESDIVDQVGL